MKKTVGYPRLTGHHDLHRPEPYLCFSFRTSQILVRPSIVKLSRTGNYGWCIFPDITRVTRELSLTVWYKRKERASFAMKNVPWYGSSKCDPSIEDSETVAEE